MSAEILRRAAALMRERAEAARAGRWGTRLASWDPAVAFAVADLLDALAVHVERDTPVADASVLDFALHLARAYLGEGGGMTEWWRTRGNIIQLAHHMAHNDWSASEVARAVEKPWAYEDQWRESQIALEIDIDIVHWRQADGSCKVSFNGQGHMPCSEHGEPS